MPELNESALESAPAPGTDSAAAADASAAASTDAAATGDTSAAAPSTEGARDAGEPRTLESIREKYNKRIEEERAGEASPTTEEAKPEKPAENAESEEAEAADEESPAAEVDPLAEFEEPKPPTREEIAKLRIPAAVKEQFAEVSEKLTEKLADEEAMGGEQGVRVAKAIAPALWSAAPGETEADAFLDAVSEANTPLALACGQRLVRTAIADETTGQEFASSLLVGEYGEGYDLARVTSLIEADKAGTIPEHLYTKVFGEGYDRARVDKLVALDKAGLVDWENADEDLAEFKAAQPSAEVSQLREENKQLKEKLQQSPDEKNRASQAEQQRQADERAVDTYVTDRAVAAVLPIAIKHGLAAGDDEEGAEDKILFGEVMTAWLNEKVKAFPEYSQIAELKRNGNAYRNGKATTMLESKTDSLQKRAKALFIGATRTLRASQTIPVPRPRVPPTEEETDGDGGEQPKPKTASTATGSTEEKPKSVEDITAKYRRRMAVENTRVGAARPR